MVLLFNIGYFILKNDQETLRVCREVLRDRDIGTAHGACGSLMIPFAILEAFGR